MDKAKHAFGSSANIEKAKQENKINEFDILFLDGDTDKPKVGWIDRNGNTVICEPTDTSELENQVSELETKMGTKVDAEAVQTMIKEYSDGVIEVIEF